MTFEEYLTGGGFKLVTDEALKAEILAFVNQVKNNAQKGMGEQETEGMGTPPAAPEGEETAVTEPPPEPAGSISSTTSSAAQPVGRNFLQRIVSTIRGK
jgi:hypothetical protein